MGRGPQQAKQATLLHSDDGERDRQGWIGRDGNTDSWSARWLGPRAYSSENTRRSSVAEPGAKKSLQKLIVLGSRAVNDGSQLG